MTPSKSRILFVDDDPMILQGLRRMLHPMRDAWEVEFCERGSVALEKIAAAAPPYDVIVSDMRMPAMNGAELLARISKTHPGMVRMILSGHADQQMVMQSVGVAHRYLSKPCDAALLTATIRQALGIRGMLRNEELRRAAAGTTTLPSRPDLYVRMLAVMQESDTAVAQVEEVISHDPAMAGKILKLVNSAFFGVPSASKNPMGLKEAISFLGLDILRSLVLTVGLFEQLKGNTPQTTVIEALWGHSFEVAEAARNIALAEEAPQPLVEEAFIGGLLHDVGHLLLHPGQESNSITLLSGEGYSDAERRLYGGTHGEAGGYLFALWGLPAGVVEAVAFHHEPRRGSPDSYGSGGLTPMLAVHVADALVHRKDKDAPHPSLYNPDETCLAQHNLLDRLPTWKDLV